MNVLGCFDHAFVLNLPEDVQRMEETREELARYDIPFERLEGGTMVGLQKNPYLGNLGCLRSHLSAVRKAKERGYKSVLIIEDDIVLRPNFSELWQDVVPQLGGLDYDLFFPYRWSLHTPLQRPIQVMKILGTLCMHFYAVHSSFYERYIADAEAQLIVDAKLKPLDILFHLEDVKTFATSYNLAGQRPARSNLSFKIRRTPMFSKYIRVAIRRPSHER